MRFAAYIVAATLLLAFAHCGKKDPSSSRTPIIHETDLTAPGDALFKKIPSSTTGITFRNIIQEDWNINSLLYPYLYISGGVGVIDVNNDGLQDLFFAPTMGVCKLYLNKGGLKFEDITAQAGVEAKDGLKTGVTISDFNTDGWQDIYVCKTGLKADDSRRNLLFINNKNATFTERGKEFGLDDPGACVSATCFDYDRDGDLDVFLANHPVNFTKVNDGEIVQNPDGTLSRKILPNDPLDSDRLLRNDGGRFTDVTAAAGLLDKGYSLSATATDLNDDGYPDLIVANDYIEPDNIYINNRNGTFSERRSQIVRHMTNNSMGCDVADINNDGLLDFMVLDMLAEDYRLQKVRMSNARPERYFTLVQYGYGLQDTRNMLQLNNGNGTFSDIGCLAGVFQTDWSWGCLFDDFDHDGFQDIYVSNGYYRDVTNSDYIHFTSDSVGKLNKGYIDPTNVPDVSKYMDLIPQFRLLNYVYRNRGDLTFEDMSVKWGLAEKSYTNGIAYADLDNDGDMDLVANNIEDEAFVYQNTASDTKKGHWLQVKLQGTPKNPNALGAKVRLQAGGQIFYKEMLTTRGYMSSVEPIVHVGLGNVSTIDLLEVEFPEGKLISMRNVPTDQRLALSIDQATPGRLTPLPTPPPMFQPAAAPDFAHQEDNFTDFNREALLPWRMSTPGPGLATGDVNGDGLPDVYIGGATGQPGGLFLQSATGGFTAAATATWVSDQAFEDTGCALVDVDGDQDLDLVVASGGTAANPTSTAYLPRLYRNDGKGNFSRTAGLPNLTDPVSALSARDFDGDGDQDLFLGGWCKPGSYPIATPSKVLQNDGKGNFTDVTAKVAPDFAKAGIVYGLEWADLDGDKQVELLAAVEWAPLRVYKNKGGQWKESAADFGLAKVHGLWRSILAADFDGDGDQDLIGGNLGLNTRYRASDAEPLRLYAKDFDQNGSMDPIMTLMQYNEEMTVAYRDILARHMPSIKKKFLRYAAYANATVTDMFPESDLESALYGHAGELHSVYWENKNGHFEAPNPLPNEAQAFPVFAQLAFDANGDGHLDLFAAGNDPGQQVETGSLDAGNGLLLLGDGKGHFKPVPARHSGLWATGAAKAMALLPRKDGSKTILVANNNGRMQGFAAAQAKVIK